MTRIFMLFMMLCDSASTNCKPHNGGYYDSKYACERAKAAIPQTSGGMCVRVCNTPTDVQCKTRWADPD